MENKTISIEDVDNRIIPKHAINKQDAELQKKYTEWCCTKYNINGKKYITISIRHPDALQILYINSQGEQIIYEMDDKYESYVIERKYWYADD
jgi:hypothetical protein